MALNVSPKRLVWYGRLGICALVALLCVAMAALYPQAFRGVEEQGTDLVWRATASHVPEQRLVFVDIDDDSLAQIGAWPWSRDTLAQLVRKLDEQGAALKMFDMVLPESREGSAEFTRALAARDATSPSVLGQLFAIRNETTLHIGQPVQPAALTHCPPAAVPAQGVLANAPGLHHRAGHITPAIDADGSVRRVPALVCYGDKAWPTLALAGLAAGAHPAAQAVPYPLQPGANWHEPAWWLQIPGIDGLRVGLDAEGYLRVPFTRKRESWVAVSAVDVLQGKAPAHLFEGAWVLVGATAFGLSDSVPTALGGAVSGAEVHAQLLTGLLDGIVPYTPQGAQPLQAAFALCVALGLLALAGGNPLHQGRRVLLLPAVGVAAAVVAYLLHAVLLVHWHWHVGWWWPACSAVLFGSALGGLEHARTLHHKGRLFSNLSSYVPGPVAERIALSAPTSDIQAERVTVTVLAADVRNFSAYCEARSPEDTARVLHRFYTVASEIVAAHGGVVEEMVGDSLLAVFNGPSPCPNHPEQALAAARQIWQRCGEELPNTYGQGLEPLAIGVGIESGVALTGSFGAAERRVHTVLGVPVTIALRLRDMTADLAYPILLGEGVAQHLPARLGQPDTMLKSLGVFLLPGMHNGGKIYTLRQWSHMGGDDQPTHSTMPPNPVQVA